MPKFYIGNRGPRTNLISSNEKQKIVINFYPNGNSDPNSKEYVQYCKYALIKYKSWKDKSYNAWGGEDATDEEIISTWTNFIKSFDDDLHFAPDYLLREIQLHSKSSQNENSDNRSE